MSESFHSQTWYRIAPLRPALKPGLEIALHSYLGRPWFVIRDPVGATVHRFTAQTWAVIGAMDGRATLDEIWHAALDRLGQDAPSQDDVLRLLIQLYQADLLRSELAPLTEELVERMGKKRARKRAKFFKNPLAVPLPLFDPDRLLERLAPLVRGRAGYVWAAAWLVLVVGAALVLPASWDALRAGGVEQFLAIQNIAIVACVYPVVKAVHELAHGLMLKRYGGECHEVGVMFLVFFPVPYVDASAAAAFPSRRARALVGAAGILAEIAIAAAALFVWRAAEPGLLRDVAYNTMLIAGFSTVVVNGNPLLKFDGYYVMSDLLEMPNLAQRSTAWWGSLARRAVGAPDPNARPVTRGEARVFALYAPAAFVYRLVVMLGISLFVASSYFVVGVLLAGWSIFQGFVLPLRKPLKPLFTDARLIEKRGRTLALGGAAAALAAMLLFAVPLPLRATLQGLVWLPDGAGLHAEAPGRVVEVLAPSGTRLKPGDPVLRLENVGLEAERARAAARVAEAQSALRVAETRDRDDIARAQEALSVAGAELARIEARSAGLVLRAQIAGRLSLPHAEDLPGRHLRQGDVVGHVLPPAAETVRAVAPQHLADLLATRMEGLALRVPSVPGPVHETALARLSPAAGRALPAPGFAAQNGGTLVLDPSDPEGLTATEPFLVIDVAAPPGAAFGAQALLRVDLGVEPVAWRIGRAMRRSFLRHFGDG